MIKKFTILFVLLICSSSFAFSQLYWNQYSTMFIDSGGYIAADICGNDYDFQMLIDSSLQEVVPGTKTVAVVTDIGFLSQSPPYSILTSYGAISIGDTLPFDTTLAYPIYLGGFAYIKWDYWIVGTPTTEGEFLCDFVTFQTLANCGNDYFLTTETGSDTCVVEIINSLPEKELSDWRIYPNPAIGHFRIKSENKLKKYDRLLLYDMQGRLLREWGSEEILDLGDLAKRSYILEIRSAWPVERHRLLLE